MERARRVLVVDDQPDFTRMLAIALKLHGYEALVCDTGHCALDTIAEFDPCVVLVDIAMPGMNGLEVATEIRRRSDSHFFLIAVTGFGREADVQACKAAGFDHHLLKPCDIQEVLRLIAEHRIACEATSSD
jgi:CheY-like chemotaxis protein